MPGGTPGRYYKDNEVYKDIIRSAAFRAADGREKERIRYDR